MDTYDSLSSSGGGTGGGGRSRCPRSQACLNINHHGTGLLFKRLRFRILFGNKKVMGSEGYFKYYLM